MKKALTHGQRIVQIADVEFPVHLELVWVDVPNDTTNWDTFVNGAVVKFVAFSINTEEQLNG